MKIASRVRGLVLALFSLFQSPCTAWSYSGQLPYGTYALHLTGTSCGGYLCRLAGASYIFVQSNLQWFAVAP